MKQEIICIKDSGVKLIETTLKKILEEGKEIQQIVMLNKTSFLILIKDSIEESEQTQGE